MLASKGVIALVARLVRPGFNAVSMLEIIFPHALVLRTVHMFVNTAPIRLVICPVSIVDIAIDVDESTFTMSTVFTPFTRVLGSVAPSLFTKTITEATLPLACVYGSSLECVSRPLLTGLIRIVQSLCDSLARLLLCKILATAHLLGLKKGNEAACSVSTPSRLEFDDEANLGHQQLRIVTIFSIRVRLAGFETTGTTLFTHLETLHVLSLTIHVEFASLTVFSYAVSAIRCTVTHLPFLFCLSIIQI